jgi:hypothetical protein
LQFFTAERLRAQARANGLLEVDAHDFQLPESDQRFPTDHPAVSSASPVAQAMRMWREAADPHGQTNQFIRAFVTYDSAGPSPSLTPDATDESFLTVVMRTQGKRPNHLRDALTCLAAQTSDSFRVLVMVHTETREEAVPATTKIVEEFDPAFADRVDVVHVPGGGRARPLNAALDRLRSAYVAFLDDDDLVTANWVEVFVGAAGEGAIVRSVAAVRHVSTPGESHEVPYTVESSLEYRYSPEFDPVYHLWSNDTPICTIAVPRSLIDTMGLRFDEQLPVLEDWDFLMRCVAFAPVRDTREVTSIYQRWRNGESSASLHDATLWMAHQRVLQDRSDQRPLVFPAGTAGRLIDMCQRLAQHPHELDAAYRETLAAREEARGRAEEVRNQAEEVRRQAEEARRQAEEVQRLGHELGLLQGRYLTLTQSLRWRVLGPPARTVAFLRRVRRRS